MQTKNERDLVILLGGQLTGAEIVPDSENGITLCLEQDGIRIRWNMPDSALDNFVSSILRAEMAYISQLQIHQSR